MRERFRRSCLIVDVDFFQSRGGELDLPVGGEAFNPLVARRFASGNIMGMDDDHRMDVENALLGPYQEKSKTFSSLKNKPFWVRVFQNPVRCAFTFDPSPEFFCSHSVHVLQLNILLGHQFVMQWCWQVSLVSFRPIGSKSNACLLEDFAVTPNDNSSSE